jgi:hypothetical protein
MEENRRSKIAFSTSESSISQFRERDCVKALFHENRLHIVANRIEQKRGVVVGAVVGAQSWLAVIPVCPSVLNRRRKVPSCNAHHPAWPAGREFTHSATTAAGAFCLLRWKSVKNSQIIRLASGPLGSLKACSPLPPLQEWSKPSTSTLLSRSVSPRR